MQIFLKLSFLYQPRKIIFTRNRMPCWRCCHGNTGQNKFFKVSWLKVFSMYPLCKISSKSVMVHFQRTLMLTENYSLKWFYIAPSLGLFVVQMSNSMHESSRNYILGLLFNYFIITSFFCSPIETSLISQYRLFVHVLAYSGVLIYTTIFNSFVTCLFIMNTYYLFIYLYIRSCTSRADNISIEWV
jgi:hypothetical protein